MMMHPNPHLLLMSRLGFTAADLAANRLGELSHSQQQTIYQRTQRHMRVGIASLAILLVIEVLFLREFMIPAFTLVTGTTLLLALRLRNLDDMRGGVAMLTGSVEQIIPAVPSGFILMIGERRFTASQHMTHAFEVGRLYRVYYTRAGRALLSAEVVTDRS